MQTSSVITGKTTPSSSSFQNLVGKPAAAQAEKRVAEGFALFLFSISQPHSNYIPVWETHEEEEEGNTNKKRDILLRSETLNRSVEFKATSTAWGRGWTHQETGAPLFGSGSRSHLPTCAAVHTIMILESCVNQEI